MEQLLWHILAGTRGGYNRLRMLDLLAERPSNAHQIAVRLSLDYRTVCHHLRVLERNQLVVHPRSEEYGSVYFVNQWLVGNPELLARIRVHVPLPSPRRISTGIADRA